MDPIKRNQIMNDAQQIKLYSDLTKLVNSSLPLDEILKNAMAFVENYFQVKHWSVFRLDSTSNELFFIVTKGIDLSLVAGLRFKLGEGIVGKVAKSGESLHIKKSEAATAFHEGVDSISGIKTESIIALPLKFRDQILGVIEIVNPETNPSDIPQMMNVMEIIANFASIAFVQTFIYQEALLLSQYDPLTGLYNRRKLKDLINEWKNIAHYSGSRASESTDIIVAMLDSDDFKSINDTYGHQAGDNLLQTIAEGLRKEFRGYDLFFRLGGDEFLIILEHVESLSLFAHEALITKRLENFTKRLENTERCRGFSYGLASGSKKDLAELINAADQKLYHSKSLK